MSVTNAEKYVDIPAKTAQEGDNAWRRGDYDEARTRYGKAAKLYDINEDYQGEAQVLGRLGEMELSLDNYEASEKALRAAGELVRDVPDAESTYGEGLIKLAKLYTAQYQLGKALEIIKQAEDVLRDDGSRNLLGDAYDQEAYIHMLDGQEERALAAYRAAAKTFEAEKITLKEASVLRAMARIEMRRKNYDEAHELLENCRALYRENGDILGEASSLSALGTLRYLIGDIENARKALMKSVYLYSKVAHHTAEAEALLYLARVESTPDGKGDFERAKAHYKRSIELYDFVQNDVMKKAVLEEYDNFLKREMLG